MPAAASRVRALLSLLLVALVAAALAAPARAAAAEFSETDWEANVSNREPGESEDWGSEWLGGLKTPTLNLLDPATIWPSLQYFGYSLLEDGAGTLVGTANEVFDSLGTIGSLDSDYAGTGDSTFATMYSLATSVQERVVSPVAIGFLGLSLALAVLEFSKETMSRHGEAMTHLASYVWIAVKFVIVMQLITHLDLLCGAIFDIFGWVAQQASAVAAAALPGVSTGGTFGSFMIQMQKLTYDQFGTAFLYLLLALVVLVVVVVTLVRVIVVSVVRLIEVYLMSAFAGFPMVMLTTRETRDAGIRFFKQYAALCLQAAVLLVLIACAGLVMAASTSLFAPQGLTGFTAALVGAIGPIAGCVAVQAMVGQSRQISDRIMGA